MLSSLQNDRERKLTPLAIPARSSVLALALAALPWAPALAGPNDALHPFVGVSYAYDDNLLRVPSGHPGFENTRADSSRRGEAGLVFDKTYGRQKLYFQGKLTKVKFRHFERLDYDGKDFNGNLAWQIGNHLEGNLGATYAQTLAPYADFRTTERNLRKQERQFFDAAWRFHPSWRVRGGASRDKFSYELLSQRFNDRTNDTLEAGADYLARSGSTVGLQLRRIEGTFPNRRVFGQFLLDDSFVQDEVKAKIYWRYSELTQLQFLGGWVKRSHPLFGTRDTSGTNARLDLTWSPRSALRITSSLWREFSGVESTLASSSLSRGVSVGAAWALTAKVKLEAQARREQRDFSGLIVGLNGIDLGDTSRHASLGAVYAPTRTVQLSMSAFHEARTGTPVFGNANYRANGVSFSANAQF